MDEEFKSSVRYKVFNEIEYVLFLRIQIIGQNCPALFWVCFSLF